MFLIVLMSSSCIHCSTHSVILNATSTQYTCSLKVSTAPTDWYCEFIIVDACAFQSTLLGCQVMWMSYKHSCYINNDWTFFVQTL